MQRKSTGSEPDMLWDIEEYLKDMLLALKEDLGKRGRGAPAILPAFCLWGGLLVCVLRGFKTQSGLWELLCRFGLWNFPHFNVCDQTIYDRLERGGLKPLQDIFEAITRDLRQRLTPARGIAPFATEVVALDETTLDAVARMLPAMRGIPDGASALLAGKLAALFDIRRQQWMKVTYIANPLQNEKVEARHMVEELPPGSLILADLGYFSFAWFDALTEAGYHWVSRLRDKTSYKVIHKFYENGETLDALVFLGAYRADKGAHAVRLVQFRVGKVLHRYITNVTEPRKFSLPEIAALYPRRWDIELAFKLIKQQLGLHLLWSAKPMVIQQQIWAVLIISQVLQAFRVQIAEKAQVDPFDVSIQLLVKWIPWMVRDRIDPIERLAAPGPGRFIRPSRRIRTEAPHIPETELCPLPPDVSLSREPRYAGK